MRAGWGGGRAWQMVAVAVATALVICLAQGADRVSSGPAAGAALSLPATFTVSSQPTKSARRLRLATFNIHGGVGTDSVYDLERTARSLTGFDFVGLNEVRSHFGEPADQATQLGQRLQQGALFAPAERQWWRDSFGNGFVTGLPVESWMRIPLACTRGKGYRNVVLATIRVDDQPVRMLVTHLDRTTDRAAQLAAVSALFLAIDPPAVLMGDFNTTADDPALQRLLKRTDVAAARDAVTKGKSAQIDWILIRGLRMIGSQRVDGPTSDHPLWWAEVELEQNRSR